ncbi:MAG: glycosyltransferase family 2 protein [Candidatus Saccharibacteria bacterium]|nr:glycosyltransferase family 2 protein [Candidatus Saccharibacteria bacterium]
MKNIEIPYESERTKRYRFFEILPGVLSWTLLSMPLVLTLINPTLGVLFVLIFLLIWFIKAIALNIRSIQGFGTLQRHKKYHWKCMVDDLRRGKVSQKHNHKHIPDWHTNNVELLKGHENPIAVDDMYHAIVIASYNESLEVLEPTVKSVIDSDFDMKRVILVMAYEERNGAQSEPAVQEIVKKYGSVFKHVMACKHPVTEGEVKGKGGNITYAARKLTNYVKKQKIDPLNVIVTTLDADNRPDKNYLNALTYVYALTEDPKYVSFQPIPMFTNNIWDAPAPMRVIATGNSFWNIILSLRQHMLRNFSSHAQSLQTLVDTDYWSVRTIVEDGHQFWRTYFRYDGNHDVFPLYVPIYQDAVLAQNYRKTIKAQFLQIRRWAWGASDVAYVAEKGFFTKSKISRLDVFAKFLRLLDGHVNWAAAPLLLALGAFVPPLVSNENFAAVQLPNLASTIQTIALSGILISLFLGLRTLPPKPARYKRRRSIGMVLQWALLPLTMIVFNSLAALNSQTRLIFGWYVGEFDVTTKTVVTDDKKRVT